MSEISKLIKSNGLTWAQIEQYLVSKNTNPAIISNLQCVFEEETGISQPAYNQPDIGSDGTSIYSEEYNGTFLDAPDNIFQESDAMDNRPKPSQKDRDMLINIIYDMKGGVVDVTPNNEPDYRLKDSPLEAYNNIVQDKTSQELMGTTESIEDTVQEEDSQYLPPSDIEPDITQPDTNSIQQETGSETTINNQTDNYMDSNNDETYSNQLTNITNFNNIITPINFTENNIFTNQWGIDGFSNGINNNFFASPFSGGFSNFSNITNPHKIKIPSINFNTNLNIPSINSNVQPSTNKDESTETVNTDTTTENETYPKLLQDRIDELDRTGNTYELSGDSKNGYTILVTAGDFLNEHGMESIKMILNTDGMLKHRLVKYNNGTTKYTNYGKKRTEIILNGDFGEPEDLKKFAEVANDNPSDITTVDYNKEEKIYTVTQTGFNKDSDITKIVTTMSSEPWQEKDGKKTDKTTPTKDDYIVKQVITYKDGTEKTFIYKEGKIISEINDSKKEDIPDKIYTAVDISFKIPENAPDSAKQFTDELSSKKEKLMKELDIDNDTYNMLAQIAIGLAGQETDMNQSPKLVKKSIERSLCENTGIIGEKIKEYAGKKYWSRGMTQIKYGMYIQEPFCKKQFEKFGINSEEDLEDPKKSAIATMIVLTSKNRLLEKDTWKTRMAQYDENHLSTKEDALIVLFHGWAKQVTALKEGRLDASKQEYLNNVKGYMSNYKLVEDADARAKAIEAEKIRRKEEEATKPYEKLDNSGPIGAIRFMPGIYSNVSKHTNTEKEITKLEEKLKEKNIDTKLSEELLNALKNKELSFDFGLRESEMDALTEADIKLILEHLNDLRILLKDVKTSDGITTKEKENLKKNYMVKILEAEKALKKEYLNKHSKVYKVTDDNPEVLRETSTYNNTVTTPEYEGRYGFMHQKSRGVNVNTTKGKIRKVDEVLAKSADNVAKSNKKGDSGYCLNGVKTAMREAGIDVSDMKKFGNTPKFAKNWFDMMVSKGLLVQVKYVETSTGNGRAINNSDIESLPAGYIGIFIPDLEGGYKKEAGHSFITNGNGQGNADMTDDLDWANFTRDNKSSGKGEHGTFYIYKLSDKWDVDENGKLYIKS